VESPEFKDPTTSKIVSFLRGIGVPVLRGALDDGTFLPGIRIERGSLVVDETRLTYCGDLLHEAGHLAVAPACRRCAEEFTIEENGGEEMAAIAWSYAAAVYLDLDPAVVFHAAGYRGGAGALLENFQAGRYIGVPFLQWIGLTAETKLACEMGVLPYPDMLRWLRA
jgi:hypothetical protein